MNNEHASLPWKQMPLGDHGEINITDANGAPVAFTGVANALRNTAENEANAALIVRAVNNHQLLIDALKELLAHGDFVFRGHKAINACNQAIRLLHVIQMTPLGPISELVQMDTQGIYGSRIWTLHAKVCGHDLTKTLGVMRAYQLGIVNAADLNHAIDHNGEGINVDDLVSSVRRVLESFHSTETQPAT